MEDGTIYKKRVRKKKLYKGSETVAANAGGGVFPLNKNNEEVFVGYLIGK